MGKKGKKMTEEEKARLPKAFRENMGRFRGNSTEEARELGKKGGEAKAEKDRRERTLAEIMTAFDRMDLTSPSVREGLIAMGIDPEFVKNLSQKEGAVAVLHRERLKGNTKAFELWAKITGEYQETVNIRQTYDNLVLGE